MRVLASANRCVCARACARRYVSVTSVCQARSLFFSVDAKCVTECASDVHVILQPLRPLSAVLAAPLQAETRLRGTHKRTLAQV